SAIKSQLHAAQIAQIRIIEARADRTIEQGQRARMIADHLFRAREVREQGSVAAAAERWVREQSARRDDFADQQQRVDDARDLTCIGPDVRYRSASVPCRRGPPSPGA